VLTGAPSPELSQATRHSLIGRLADWQDHARWQTFFETYWRLIYSVARRAGLTDAEAQDTVQETILSVARSITRYDRAAGRFKPWLLQMTRWRIADQLRKRLPTSESPASGPDSTRDTATLDRIAGPGFDLTQVWETEWQERLLEAALERLKRQVKPAHYQVFHCALRQRWPAAKIARELSLNIAQVYLIKHRLTALLKKELRRADEGASAG
jgi:RNA polymerase sigma-70 factor (ECF subfamily)